MSYYRPGAYDVEDRVFGGRFIRQRIRAEGMSLADQREILDRLVEAHPTRPCEIRRRGGKPSDESYANYRPTYIAMGALAGPAMVCHEYAHILAGSGNRHNTVWQLHYVECVRLVIGDYHADRLQKAFMRFEITKARNRSTGAKRAAKTRARREASGTPVLARLMEETFS